MADRLSHTQEAGGSNPPSSTVAEVEVDDTPGCGPGGSRFESGRSPHRTAGIWDERGFIRLARGFDSRSRDQWASGATGSAAPLQGEGCRFDSDLVHAR